MDNWKAILGVVGIVMSLLLSGIGGAILYVGMGIENRLAAIEMEQKLMGHDIKKLEIAKAAAFRSGITDEYVDVLVDKDSLSDAEEEFIEEAVEAAFRR